MYTIFWKPTWSNSKNRLFQIITPQIGRLLDFSRMQEVDFATYYFALFSFAIIIPRSPTTPLVTYDDGNEMLLPTIIPQIHCREVLAG
jgi:hypothetical protein